MSMYQMYMLGEMKCKHDWKWRGERGRGHLGHCIASPQAVVAVQLFAWFQQQNWKSLQNGSVIEEHIYWKWLLCQPCLINGTSQSAIHGAKKNKIKWEVDFRWFPPYWKSFANACTQITIWHYCPQETKYIWVTFKRGVYSPSMDSYVD